MSTDEIKINLKSFGIHSRILIMENGIIEWINGQLREREWSMRQLAKKAGLSQTQVSNVLAGKRNVTRDFCVEVARAFGEPPEKVLRLAGLLPPEPALGQNEDKLLSVYRQLPKEQQRFVVDMLRGLQGQPVPQQIIVREAGSPYLVTNHRRTVPDAEEIMDALKDLDEPERWLVWDYIQWRLLEKKSRRDSDGNR